MGRSLRSKAHQVLIAELRQAREDAGMTQQALADLMNRPQSYVAKIEIGERRIDVIEFLEWMTAVGGNHTDVLEQARAVMQPSNLCR